MPDLNFDMPQHQSSVIKVIGVGGGGSNAVNYMFQKGIRGVDFVVCNTDQQALEDSQVPNKIQLGIDVTEGLGAGADPEKGRVSALENIEDVTAILENNTKMVFINAGMGGGTGTGAAPVIAQAAKEMGILTVAIVTIPFIFEGKLRMIQAEQGIIELKKHVDSLIVINNNKLREIYGNLGFKSGFAKADEILATASRGIAEVITQPGHLNIDLNDARTVLQNSGTAIMGSATASGENRAVRAVKGALESPLLDNNHIHGAKKVLLLIMSGADEVTFEEMGEISDFIQGQASLDGAQQADIIMGVAEDANLEDSVTVTVIATGFHEGRDVNPLTLEPERVVHPLHENPIVEVAIEKQLLTESIAAITEVQEVKQVFNLEDTIEEDIQDIAPIVEVKEEYSAPIVEDSSDQEQVSMSFEFEFDAHVQQEVETVIEEEKVVFNLDSDLAVEEEPASELEQEIQKYPIASEFANEENIVVADVVLDVEEPLLNSTVETIEEPNMLSDFEESNPVSFTIDAGISSEEPSDKIVHTLDLDEDEDEDEGFAFDLSGSAEEETFTLSTQEPSVPVEAVPMASINPQLAPSEEPKVETLILDELEELEEEIEEVEESTLEAIEQPLMEEKPSVTLSTQTATVQDQIERARQRKLRLQKFNYRFRNNSVIEEAEREPAYKRQGVELKDPTHSSEEALSRVSLSTNDNGGIELKTNNSFLHDNVD